MKTNSWHHSTGVRLSTDYDGMPTVVLSTAVCPELSSASCDRWSPLASRRRGCRPTLRLCAGTCQHRICLAKRVCCVRVLFKINVLLYVPVAPDLTGTVAERADPFVDTVATRRCYSEIFGFLGMSNRPARS